MLDDLLRLRPRVVKMGGRRDGDDLFQETYLALQRSGASDPSEQLVICVASRKLVDIQRREARRRHKPLAVETLSATRGSDPILRAQDGEARRAIEEAAKCLPAKQREAFEFVFLSGIQKRADAEREFATQRSLSINTVRTRIGKALRHVRHSLSGRVFY